LIFNKTNNGILGCLQFVLGFLYVGLCTCDYGRVVVLRLRGYVYLCVCLLSYLKYIKHSINQLTNQLVNQSIHQSIEQTLLIHQLVIRKYVYQSTSQLLTGASVSACNCTSATTNFTQLTGIKDPRYTGLQQYQ